MESDREPLGLSRPVPPEITRCLRAANPGFQSGEAGYLENCQRCVAAYELLRRGYAVMARPRVLSRPDPLTRLTGREGWPTVFGVGRMEPCGAATPSMARERAARRMRGYGEGSRAVVKITWLHNGQGHVFMAELLRGQVYFVDPQSGVSDVDWYFGHADPARVFLMRTDQAPLAERISLCCEPSR